MWSCSSRLLRKHSFAELDLSRPSDSIARIRMGVFFPTISGEKEESQRQCGVLFRKFLFFFSSTERCWKKTILLTVLLALLPTGRIEQNGCCLQQPFCRITHLEPNTSDYFHVLPELVALAFSHEYFTFTLIARP